MKHFRLPVDATAEQIQAQLTRMKHAQNESGPPSIAIRKDRIERALDLILSNRHAIVAAISEDFGNRSLDQSMFGDILSSAEALRYNRDHVEEWARAADTFEPAPGIKARVEYQPLGVVGIISPWNFPIVLAFSPIANAFAAGNRIMLKPSEHTPRTSDLVAELIEKYFDSDELTTVVGGPASGAAFSRQAFDHLIFTGSTQVAHHVMKAAADNLVPVTLELGGKSPVIVAADANLKSVAERVLTVKTFNAGQICLAPDYVLIRPEKIDEFVSHATAAIKQMYPTIKDNDDYTSMVNARGFERQQALSADAKAKGATVLQLGPKEDLSDPVVRKVAPALVVGATEDMRVLQEEVFGPILPIVPYTDIDEAIAFINARPRPLALYYFGETASELDYVSARTTAGAVVANDAMTHVFFDTLPFGGVGASGMGHYHGEFGFRALSHAKPVLVQSIGGEFNLLMRAPYDSSQRELVSNLIGGQD
ncbi:coniferyl aldehyde dehydrogenase [Burkholderia sp. 3C]